MKNPFIVSILGLTFYPLVGDAEIPVGILAAALGQKGLSKERGRALQWVKGIRNGLFEGNSMPGVAHPGLRSGRYRLKVA